MTDIIDTDIDAIPGLHGTTAPITPQPLTKRQRQFITAFAVLGGLALIAYLALTLQLGNEITVISNSIAHSLMSSK